MAKYAFKHKPCIQDAHTPPVKNEWYTVCDLSGGLEIMQVAIQQNNDETAVKNVEWEFTIDDEVYTDTDGLPDSKPWFYGFIAVDALNLMSVSGDSALQYGFGKAVASGTDVQTILSFYCHKFKLRYRLTSDAGTNQKLYASVAYSSLEAV